MDDKIRAIRQGARVVQATTGFTLGLYLFIYGLYFYEKFGGNENPKVMLWLAIVFMVSKAVTFLCDIPTGAIADWLGRRRTIIAAFAFQAIYFLSLAAIWFIDSPAFAFGIATFGYGVFGIGYALLSGAFVAWVVDSVRAQQMPEGHGVILADSYQFYFVAQLLGTVIGLALYTLHLAFFAFVMGFIACTLCVVYATLVMEETEGMRFYDRRLSWSVILSSGTTKIRDGFRVMRRNPAVFCLALTNACFMFQVFVVTYLWPVVLKSQFGFGKLSRWWYLIAIATVITSYLGTKTLQTQFAAHKLRGLSAPNRAIFRWFFVGCLAAAVPIMLFAVREGPLQTFAFPLLICGVIATYGGYGFLRPCYETLVNNYLGVENAYERATALSIGSSFSSLLAIIFMIPSGRGIDTGGSGWIIPSCLLIGSAITTLIVIKRYETLATRAAQEKQRDGIAKIVAP